MSTQVVLVLLNWNNAPDTLRCLKSLEHADYNADIIVVDNGSTDDSVARIRQQFPKLEQLETGRNLGYAGGNNAGFRFALESDTQYIGVLNNDVTVAPDSLTPLMAALEQDAQVGVVTPLVADMNRPDTVWAVGQAIDWTTGSVTRNCAGEPVVRVQTRAPLEVDAASGTCMVIRRQVLERVGLLDESFFLYYEETDWCIRVRQAGYRILGVPTSTVWHAVSSTLGQTSPVTDYYMLRNHLRLIARHWSGATRWRLMARTVLQDLHDIAAYTTKPWGGRRLPNRNARVLALRDALLGRWGKMGSDVALVCHPDS